MFYLDAIYRFLENSTNLGPNPLMVDQRVLSLILRREKSLFSEDFEENRSNLAHHTNASRILVIGAAGSVGKAFVHQLVRFSPRTIHLVDPSENELVELVRDLRSSSITLPNDFRTYAIALGSEEFSPFFTSQPPYDYIANFAALKHVRSERDPFTLMRMFNTNVEYLETLLEMLSRSSTRKVFSVSSDKAVCPTSLMGASKAFMEQLLLRYAELLPFSTARFANIAFSSGSLLQGFLHRIEKRQPLSAPSDVKRYFMSPEEAGQLCLLSLVLGKNRDIYFPKLDESLDLLDFPQIAAVVLESLGMECELCQTEQEAKEKAAHMPLGAKKWPCYFSVSDTTGEKQTESFFSDEDIAQPSPYKQIGIVHRKNPVDRHKLDAAFEQFSKIRASSRWSKNEMVEAIRLVVPEMSHEELNQDLDRKM